MISDSAMARLAKAEMAAIRKMENAWCAEERHYWTGVRAALQFAISLDQR